MTIMMTKTHPKMQKYRIIGFDKIEHLREYFAKKFNIQRRFVMLIKSGINFEKQWFDIKFVCINNEQKKQLNEVCWKHVGELNG